MWLIEIILFRVVKNSAIKLVYANINTVPFKTLLPKAIITINFWVSVPKTKLHQSSFNCTYSVQFSSVQLLSHVQLCDPMNHSTPGLPVHHQLLELTQTHVHWISDAIQPSHPLSSPLTPAPNPSQHQGLFQWVNTSHEVVKVLEFQVQHQSFQ